MARPGSAGLLPDSGLVAGLFCILLGLPAAQADAPRPRPLEPTAERIIALSPHAAELVYAAGAGDKLVASVAYSDYPEPVTRLPQVGDAARLDRERILRLEPDLIVAWTSGNRTQDLEWLAGSGFRVLHSDPRRLEQIAEDIERIGRLAGTRAAAEDTAGDLRRRLQRLRAEVPGGTPLRVFYQLWGQPLMSVDREHIIGDLLRLCGAESIFPRLAGHAAGVSVEAVLTADPQAIVASDASAHPFERWRGWPDLLAVREQRFVQLPADWVHRATPRMLDAAEALCRELDRIR